MKEINPSDMDALLTDSLKGKSIKQDNVYTTDKIKKDLYQMISQFFEFGPAEGAWDNTGIDLNNEYYHYMNHILPHDETLREEADKIFDEIYDAFDNGTQDELNIDVSDNNWKKAESTRELRKSIYGPFDPPPDYDPMKY